MIILKSLRMLTVGLIAGIFLATTASTFAEGETSKISAYLREGFTFKVKGEPITLKNTPIVYQDTTYLPVRELAGILGYDVGFEDNTITLDPKAPTEAEQSIEKDVTNVTTTTEPQTIDSNVWISAREIAEAGILVTVGPEQNVMTLKRSDDTYIQFLSTDIKENDTVEISLLNRPESITVQSYKGRTYFKIQQLRALGVLD